jgi:transposase
MNEISTIGLDIAKSVFQVHGVDACGAVVVWRQSRRSEILRRPPIVRRWDEACSSAHYWARQVGALGHEVRLLPPAHVKPYVKRGRKNDAADAAALAEAVGRPQMSFEPVTSAEQQSVVMLHRTRDLLVRQRTMLICALRSHLAEFGRIAAQGKGGFARLVASLDGPEGEMLPETARAALRLIAAQIDEASKKIQALETAIVTQHRELKTSRRLAPIPGIGPITASALVAAVLDASIFKSGGQLAAWLGLVPRQNSTGGKERLGGITKTGDRYLSRLLVIGATGLIRYKRKNIHGGVAWLAGLLDRTPARLVTVALANRGLHPASDFPEPLLKSFDASVVESIDASDYEGVTIIADFNKPLGDRHRGKFTSFIDFGAMEHIFNEHLQPRRRVRNR